MARFCTHCGNQVHEQAVVCIKCGCPLPPPNEQYYSNGQYYANGQNYSNGQQYAQNTQFGPTPNVVSTISQRFQINGIIWIVIAVLQILSGIGMFNLFLLAVGVLNLVSAIQDINFSKSFSVNPIGAVDRVRSLTGPIITFVYNLIFGGVIGVIGSIYYFVAIRGYIMENERQFLDIEYNQKNNHGQFRV